MKYCPQCQKQYTEVWITFCSDDGTILTDTGYTPSQQPPPQSGGQRPPYAPPGYEPQNWRSPDPNSPGGWVNPIARPVAPQPWQPPPPPMSAQRQQQSQGVAVASMIVGILSLFLGAFCLGPIPGVAAIILGCVALSQIKKAPERNTGKPLAIAGIVTGSIGILLFVGFLLLGIIGQIFTN